MRYRRVRSGESLDGALSASAWTEMLDVVERTQVRGGATDPASVSSNSRFYATVKNTSTVDCPDGGVLELIDVVGENLAAWRRRPIWHGDTPQANAGSHIAIATAPLAADRTGRLVTGGVVAAKVSLGHVLHRWAYASSTSAYLLSGFHGNAEILRVGEAVGSGVFWAYLRLGVSRTFLIRGKPDTTIAPGGSAVCKYWNTAETTATFTAHLTWMDDTGISSGKEIIAMWDEDLFQWVVIGAQCES